MPQVTVPEETFRRLSERAAALNVSVDSFILPALERLIHEPEASRSDTQLPLTGDAWQKEFEAWRRDAENRAGRYPPGFVLDDSRETMYREREDRQL